MVATTLVLIPIAGMNWLYTAVAVAIGALFLFEAYALRTRVRTNLDELNAMRLFHWSISYLSLIFLAVGIDPFL
jgi:protoheme IX farnesyltransferase